MIYDTWRAIFCKSQLSCFKRSTAIDDYIVILVTKSKAKRVLPLLFSYNNVETNLFS